MENGNNDEIIKNGENPLSFVEEQEQKRLASIAEQKAKNRSAGKKGMPSVVPDSGETRVNNRSLGRELAREEERDGVVIVDPEKNALGTKRIDWNTIN